ncbi:MAG: YceI family protein [Verrucomicrobia bacterium]|nr:YceI family protein [Deltaproteobacteria bacterium]
MNAILSCNELMQRIEAGAVVIDVMTPEEYAIRHLAGAKNACIYEMVFLDHMAEQVPDRDTELIVYDATGRTRSAELARERLLQAGYADVSILSGGLAAWRDAGLPVEADLQAFVTEPELRDGTYRIDTEKSTLEWIGRNLNKRHYGRIAIQAGELVIAGGKLSAGNIVLDMTAISNSDLQDPGWHEMLIRHLISDDFFAVERYPIASFTLSGWEAQAGASPEAPQGIVTGELTIKDVTRPISFPATVAPQQDGSIQAHAAFDIDRTLWNICYGSCRMFENLGMHLVHDTISLELFVVASRP